MRIDELDWWRSSTALANRLFCTLESSIPESG